MITWDVTRHVPAGMQTVPPTPALKALSKAAALSGAIVLAPYRVTESVHVPTGAVCWSECPALLRGEANGLVSPLLLARDETNIKTSIPKMTIKPSIGQNFSALFLVIFMVNRCAMQASAM
jgi:hypothetical protein